MKDEHKDDGSYDDVYGFTRPPEQILAEMVSKANPHIPPWLHEESDDVLIQVLYAIDTGELVWIKDPKQRKSHLTSENERSWRLGWGTGAFIVWTLWANYVVSPSLESSTGFEWFLKFVWVLIAWFMPAVFYQYNKSDGN
jgi:hypothetical protein